METKTKGTRTMNDYKTPLERRSVIVELVTMVAVGLAYVGLMYWGLV